MFCVNVLRVVIFLHVLCLASAWPRVVLQAITSPMTLTEEAVTSFRCSMEPDEDCEDPLPGDQECRFELDSILITRGTLTAAKKSSKGFFIAPEIFDGQNVLSLSSYPNNTMDTFLELKFINPQPGFEGEYKCAASVTDRRDNTDKYLTSSSITISSPVESLLQQTYELQDKINATLNEYIGLKNRFNHLRTRLSQVKLRMETGSLNLGFLGGSINERHQTVSFITPYETIPAVFVVSNSMEVEQEFNYRIHYGVYNVTTSGFTFGVSTWDDSFVHKAEFTWVSVSA